MGAPGNLIAIAALTQRAPTPAPPAAEAGNVTVPELRVLQSFPGGLEDVIVIVCVTANSAQSRVLFCRQICHTVGVELLWSWPREGFASRSRGCSFSAQQSLLIPLADDQPVATDSSLVSLPQPKGSVLLMSQETLKHGLSNGNIFTRGSL